MIGKDSDEDVLQSFWMGGFECADHQNAFGERVDMIMSTGHDKFLLKDYKMVSTLGIRTLREGIRWSNVEKEPFKYDWSGLERIISAAKIYNIQIIWDLCHFGFPSDLTPLHPMFAARFAHLCKAFVIAYRQLSPTGVLIVTPINEVSFLSWLGGEVRGTVPYCTGQGWAVKYGLMKAYIEGIEVMRAIDPSVQIMSTEPLVNIVSTQPDDYELSRAANERHCEQFQVLEILSGRICPELRGKPEYLDIVGVNFYYNNQWTYPEHHTIPWDEVPPHPQWRRLSSLIEELHETYGRHIVISETSHPGRERAKWIDMIADEVILIFKKGIPLVGVCFYPLLDRPDWDFLADWHRSGFWDITDPILLDRSLHQPSADALSRFKVKLWTAGYRL
ncbi:amine oxidase [Sphingobacterium oryzagri]|uniref:Amine oxidase n=1 Tax=Sphingobacterium oryzagri TaxID=3025669 RepID=A0ABY7WBB2_9SPHI|nr:amine oxidase [Sphingobacterium sp. KACC 22765]WDF66952.1 amine oxidase [Sphingobacterium sp. KACC 22765]